MSQTGIIPLRLAGICYCDRLPAGWESHGQQSD